MIKIDLSGFQTKVKELSDKVDGLNLEIAQVLSTIIEEEFEKMLMNAPQWSGNFVANMYVRTGSASGRKKNPVDAFPEPKSVREAFERGKTPAIQYALSENGDIRDRLTKGITKKAGWFPGAIIYNRLPEGDEIESMDSRLRPINRPGAHPLTQMEAQLNARLRNRLVIGSTEWESLRNKR